MDDIDTYRRISRVAARTKDPMLKLISEKYAHGQRGQGISHVAIRHFQCVCMVHHIGYTNAYAEDYLR